MSARFKRLEVRYLTATVAILVAWGVMNVAFQRELPEGPLIAVTVFCAMCSAYYQGRRHGCADRAEGL